MRSGFVIVRGEQLDLLVESRFGEDDHMIEALAPDAADHALDVSSLPLSFANNLSASNLRRFKG